MVLTTGAPALLRGFITYTGETNMRTKHTLDISHAVEIIEDAASFVAEEHILPCDEGNAVAESLATLAMNLRYDTLIAAAPELLAALKALLAYADAYSEKMLEIGRGAEELGEGADSSSVAGMARAAIAKAEGR